MGKTYTAGTLNPKTTLIITSEKGLLTLAGKNLVVWEAESWRDLETIYQELLKPENERQFKTIFVDSLTEINELCKDHIVKIERPAIKIDLGKVYQDLMTMQDYGLLQTKMTRFIRSYRDLNYHVIFTALENQEKDEKTGSITITPSLNGKLQLNIAGFFDEVFRLVTSDEGEKISRYFVTDAGEKAIAKDRAGVLETLEKPDWSYVFKKIFTKFNTKEVAA